MGARIVVDGGPADLPAHLDALIRTRVPDIDLLRRRLARPRPGRPLRWVADAVPDPDRHLDRRPVVIGPGGDHPTWDDAVTAFFAEPVDPFTTGWRLRAAREPATGRQAVLAKVHHTLGDGLAVTDALIRLLTDETRPAWPTSRRPRRRCRCASGPTAR
ncbi:hypothetical protein BJF78_10540 [Pseudonocardia sp. CNS-139]|nr:hypothetical protein BJF78_10540 [Pseudonocardia sp. CNS-139]